VATRRGQNDRVTIGKVVLLGLAYILPTTDAIILRFRNRGRIVAVNLLTGWTIVGWLVALGMAYRWAQAKHPIHTPVAD
jgi:hypothetical protein